MIIILDKRDCCGCSACAQVCPKRCITMIEDKEGFLYPSVNLHNCVDCHLCEKVCPMLNQGKPHEPEEVYAAKSNDEKVRIDSSSGGIFTVLAEEILAEKGIIFGAKFNEKWEVVHDYTDTKEGIAAFRGSKYVQSSISDTYKKVESFLKQGRKVLFSGTPCQIRGLKLFLRKDYDNLLTVDFICHGVPSPKIWRIYLKETIACKKEKATSSHATLIKNISFRDKRLGWKKYSFSLTYFTVGGDGERKLLSFSEPLEKNIFLRGFMSNLFLRPSCHSCKCREFRSGSDITIADCWGLNKIYPDFDDDKGYSLCIVKNKKISSIRNILFTLPIEKDFIYKYNHSCFISDVMPANRTRFFELIEEGKLSKLICSYATFPDRNMKAILVRILNSVGLLPLIKK